MKWIDEDTISFEWCVDDVLQCKKDYGISNYLSRDDCREILSMCECNHGRSLGMSWEVMVYYIREFLRIM